MPASASPPPSVPFPAYNAPHASGPASYQQPGNVLMKQQHRHGHSADYADPTLGQKPSRSHTAHARLSEQNLSKPLPIKPEQDYATYSRQSGRSAAEQYKQQSLQKLEGKESRGRTSADLPSGYAHAPSGSMGRRATVDARPSATSASRGSNGARRKPVRDPSPAEFFNWDPTDEPQVLTTPIAADMPSSSHKSRNRQMGIYKDAPAPPTWSKGTAPRPDERYNLSASTGHQPSSQPTHFVISSSSLGRHHSASASVPVVLPGSARTVQGIYTPTAPAYSNSNQKIPYTATSTSTTPTPKAQTFKNISSSKQTKHASMSNQEFPTEERNRKLSHHRTASASTQAASPSSCSTTGSSHFDTWASANSQTSHRQRSRGMSDAPAPQTHYLGKAMGLSEVSVGKSREEEERGRKKEKEDTSIMGRIRSRSNSLTKSISKVINYPKYLKEKGEEKKKEKEAKRLSKQQALGQSTHGGSAILATSTSDNGHSIAYSYTTSSSNATSTSATNSPISGRSHSQSAQPRPKKLVSARDQQLRNDYRASPMTKAKENILEYWDGVDLDPRMSGIAHTQVQVEQRFMPMVVPFAREDTRLRRPR